MTPAVEHLSVVVTVDALTQQRARAGAPAGTAVVADREIAGRLRGGVEWRPEHGVSVAVIARPVTLEPTHADAATLAAALAASETVSELVGPASCVWPDAVVAVDVDDVTIRADAVTLLGPGRVDAAILVVRVGSARAGRWDTGQMAAGLVDRLRERASLIDRPEELRQCYSEVCGTLGTRVRVGLLPHGACRGEAVDVRADGCLVVRTAGGSDEVIAMSAVAMVGELD